MAFRKKQHNCKLCGLHKSLRWVNLEIYQKGLSPLLRQEQESLQSKISMQESSVWAQETLNFQQRWLFLEGKMKPEFLHLEDQKHHLDPIIALDTPSGIVEIDDEVLYELHSFYEELYSEHDYYSDVEITDFLLELDLPTIDPIEHEAVLGGVVSEAEVIEVIGKLKVGKSLGPDGLIPEFYKHFAPILASLLASCFNSAMLASYFYVMCNNYFTLQERPQIEG